MTDTYGLSETSNFSLTHLRQAMAARGVTQILWKPLSPNDNSKNQPYLGGDFSALNCIPTGPFSLNQGSSDKPSTRAGKSVIKASLQWFWLAPSGHEFVAPYAQLILYPQYPEVRLSGFLKGSKANLSEWMQPQKNGRCLGRHLILGTTDNGKIYGYLAVPGSQVAQTLESLLKTSKQESVTSVLYSIPIAPQQSSNKEQLLSELRRIHLMGWHRSKRLKRNSTGGIEAVEYIAANGGGYTLEALLNIFPNGDSAPDYKGWEIKQYSVTRCEKSAHTAKPVTLMTPEPDGGYYRTAGVSDFVRKFGYADKRGRPNRHNFGGTHYYGKSNASTHLSLHLSGTGNGNTFDAAGAVELCAQSGEIAASWSYTKLLNHWKKKHAQAAYVPAIAQAGTPRQYFYCSPVYLGEGTDFGLYINALRSGNVYYDPGIKLELDSNNKEKTKRRSQFRIRFKEVQSLYKTWTAASLD